MEIPRRRTAPLQVTAEVLTETGRAAEPDVTVLPLRRQLAQAFGVSRPPSLATSTCRRTRARSASSRMRSMKHWSGALVQ